VDPAVDVAALVARAAAGRPEDVAAALTEARERTWYLAAGLDDDALATPAAEYLSPPVWDLGHIANFEERWLVQALTGADGLRAGYNDIYDAFRHPRHERPTLHLLDRGGVRGYMDEVRAAAFAVLATLASVTLRDAHAVDWRWVEGFYVHWMIALHEHQHQETLLQTIQMRGAEGRYAVPGEVRRLPAPDADRVARLAPWCSVPAGRFTMGTPRVAGVYDNEAPPHKVDVDAFDMARFPVTCAEYLAFMADGGYEDASLWTPRGRAWLDDEPHHAPLYWRADRGASGGWLRVGPGCRVPVAAWPDVILSHVTHFEAEAYAAWAARRDATRGARLPTEAEWEMACRCDPASGRVVGNPWGHAPATTDRANVDQLSFAPSRIGAFPSGASKVGCEHMIGDVWEWCSDGFEGYPGFAAFPYEEYSQVFFGGDYRVLRGGSWATRAGCATGTFRNWDHPYRRQIFTGIRLARDA
jgi:iron(II)-dependent oxidoreductase